jgi:hypothetical protein
VELNGILPGFPPGDIEELNGILPGFPPGGIEELGGILPGFSPGGIEVLDGISTELLPEFTPAGGTVEFNALFSDSLLSVHPEITTIDISSKPINKRFNFFITLPHILTHSVNSSKSVLNRRYRPSHLNILSNTHSQELSKLF